MDVTAFVYPTWGKACGGPGIWPHRSVYETWWGAAYVTDDPSANGGFVRVSDYIIQGGETCFGASLMEIGTIAHLSAWSKLELGWMSMVTVGATTSDLNIQPAETTGAAIRIDHPADPDEYFLLENRQRIGSDAFLRETGLLVWHVDSATVANRRLTNTIQNDPNHPGIDLEAADGSDDLVVGINRGDAGDPFPGSTGNTAFHDSSNPNPRSYGGLPGGFGLVNIAEIGQTIILDVTFGPPWGDVNEDGIVALDDAEAILLEVIGGDSGANIAYADVDGDGDIDARDGLIVHSFVAGVEISACVECRVGEPAGAGAVAGPDIPEVVPYDVGDARPAPTRRLERLRKMREEGR